jgi:hypothetical protein
MMRPYLRDINCFIYSILFLSSLTCEEQCTMCVRPGMGGLLQGVRQQWCGCLVWGDGCRDAGMLALGSQGIGVGFK